MRRYLFFLFIGIILWACQARAKPAENTLSTATQPSPTATSTAARPSPSPSATASPTPSELIAWMDPGVDLDHFNPLLPLVIHFSQPVDSRSSRPLVIVLPDAAGSGVWDQTRTVLTYTLESQTNHAFGTTTSRWIIPGQSYQIMLNAGIISQGGAYLAERPEWTITVVDPDMGELPPTGTKTPNPYQRTATPTASPTPTQTPSPTVTPQGAYAVLDATLNLQAFPPTRPLIFHFNTPVNPHSASPAVSVFPWVEGEETWSADATTLTFQPAAPLTAGQLYHVYFDRNLKTADGQSLNGVTDWLVAAGRGPRVISLAAANQALTDRRPIFKLTFDRPMDAESVAAALSVQPAISFDLDWQENTLVITSTQVLTPGLQVTFNLAGSAADEEGAPMGADYTWHYDLPAFTAQVAAADSGSGRKGIVITFSYPMARSLVESALSFSPTLTSTLTWGSDTELRITPEHPQDVWAVRELRFDAELQDSQNQLLPGLASITYAPPNPIAPSRWSGYYFHLDDITSPLEIKFQIPVDRASVEAAFQIEPVIEGSFTWSGNTLSFQPAKPLEIDINYTVILLPSARSEAGQAFLIEPFELVFYVNRWGNASFGEWGANLQVVDADGSRAIQFQNGDSDRLEFSLYRLDLPTFIERYRAGFAVEYINDQQRELSTDGGELTASWPWTPGQMDARAVVPEVYLPQDAAPGFYILNLNRAGVLFDQLFVVLTRNTLVVKKAGDELLVWVSDINGESAAQIEVRLYSTRGEKIRLGQADSDGLYRTTVPQGYDPLLVVARTPEGDFAISGLEGIWQFNYSYYSHWFGVQRSANQPYYAFPYTDRPIYRPGQMVYFKAIVRADRDVKYSLLPEGTPVTVRIRDERENELYTFELATNAFGAVNGEFQLPEGGMLGNYIIEAVVDGYSFRQIFKVQDYRKPDIQVSIAADAAQYVTGDPMTVTVDASYFFGQPVANASIQINSYRLQTLNCWWFDCSPEQEGQLLWFKDYQNKPIYGKTDANGRFVINLPAAYKTGDYYYDYDDEDSWYGSLRSRAVGLEVTLNDGSGQTVSSFTLIKVYNAADKLSLEVGSSVKPTGMPFEIQAGIVTIAEEPVAGRVLTLELRQWNSKKYTFSDIITATQLTTGPDGFASLTITPPKSGHYQLRLSGKDSRGNPIRYNRYLYIYAPGDSWANAYTSSALTISADQTEVKPYQTVSLLIESTFSGPALLTFERGRVNRTRAITLTAPLTTVDVEIIPEDAPNIFVTVNAWQDVDPYPPDAKDEEHYDLYWEHSQADSILRTASVELSVDASDKALTVSIQSDQQVYTPRQQATFTMTVTDAQGQPVQAELSLALVDEAIYALSSDLTPEIFAAFYGSRRNAVSTYDSMHPYRVIIQMGSGGGDGGGDGPNSPRSDFPDTAVWYPSIVTDPNGVATVSLALPDNLTTWRVVVKAVDQRTQVGEAVLKVLTQQPVVVRPQLPRSLTTGDQVELSAFVHNFSAVSLDLVASIQISDLSLLISGALTQSVSLAPGEARLVNWEAAALAPGEPLITISAYPAYAVFFTAAEPGAAQQDTMGAAFFTVDAVQTPLVIHPLSVPEVSIQVGAFQDQFDTVIPLPETALSQSTLRLELSRSTTGELLSGLEYLTGYPYGCVEQTMSRALPNAVVGRALDQLTVPFTDAGGASTRKDALAPLIRAGLQRLYGYQHDDGGWGWWYDDDTNDYQTAWVVFGLAMTAQAGFSVEPKVIERGANWLQEHLEEMDIRTRAYALYSMTVAGYGALPDIEALDIAAFSDLDPFSQAALALAYHKLGADDQALVILDRLAASATQRDGLVYWPLPYADGYYHEKTMASTTRSTALVLDAFVQIAPQHALIPGIVQWLMSQRRSYGWGSTNETAFAILALTDHLLAIQETLGETEVVIEINALPVMTATLGAQQPLIELDIPFEQLTADINHLSIRQTRGSGVIYYRLNQRLYLAQTEIPAHGAIRIQRRYLDPKTRQPVESLIPGQLVLVQLIVTMPEDGFFMILEDRLPGGLEALNENLNNASHEAVFKGDYFTEMFLWRDYGYNNKEIRGDRVSFFIKEMNQGKHIITYLARVTRPGQFTALPAEAYAMYDDTLWGRSDSQRLAILPR